MKKIALYGVSALTVLIFALAFYIMIFGAIAASNNRLLNIFGYSYSVVPTGSMEGDLDDSLHVGDMILIKRTTIDFVDVGDVIVFYSIENDIHIAHRIIEVTDEGALITKGDANASADDELVTSDMVIGQVVLSFNFLNIGLLSVNYRSFIFIIIIFIIIFIMIKEVSKIMKTLKEKQRAMYDQELNEAKKALLEAEKEKLRHEIINEQKNNSK